MRSFWKKRKYLPFLRKYKQLKKVFVLRWNSKTINFFLYFNWFYWESGLEVKEL